MIHFFFFIPFQGVFTFAQLNRNPEYLKKNQGGSRPWPESSSTLHPGKRKGGRVEVSRKSTIRLAGGGREESWGDLTGWGMPEAPKAQGTACMEVEFLHSELIT